MCVFVVKLNRIYSTKIVIFAQIIVWSVGKFKDIWDRDKDIDNKNAEKRSFIRYAIVTSAIFVLLVGFLNQNSIVRWIKAGIEINRQDKLIEKYTGEIKEMEDQIHGLTSNKDSLEQFARENFGFAEPGDDVYVVEERQ